MQNNDVALSANGNYAYLGHTVFEVVDVGTPSSPTTVGTVSDENTLPEVCLARFAVSPLVHVAGTLALRRGGHPPGSALMRAAARHAHTGAARSQLLLARRYWHMR